MAEDLYKALGIEWCLPFPLSDDNLGLLVNYDRNNNQIDHFYTQMGLGSGKLSIRRCSAAANQLPPMQRPNDDWYTEVLADRLLLQDLPGHARLRCIWLRTVQEFQ